MANTSRCLDDSAEQVLEQLDRAAAESYVSPFSYAVIHAGLGNAEGAIDHLQAALNDRAWRMAWLSVVPFFDDLRTEPRFQSLAANLTPDRDS